MHIASQEQLIQFYHAVLGSPAISTLTEAINKQYLKSFPGLTAKLVRKYYPNSYATSKGHLDQTRKNQRSSKTKSSPQLTTASDDNAVNFPKSCEPTKELYIAVVSNKDFEQTGKTYMDSAGRFPVKSRRGNEYCFLMYSYDSK